MVYKKAFADIISKFSQKSCIFSTIFLEKEKELSRISDKLFLSEPHFYLQNMNNNIIKESLRILLFLLKQGTYSPGPYPVFTENTN